MYKKFTRKNTNIPGLVLFIGICAILFIISACELPQGNYPEENNNEDITRGLLYPNDFTTTVFSPDNLGYLKTNAAGKKFLHLEGTGYQMGFQHGYLLAQNVQTMTSENFVIAVLSNLLGMSSQDFRTAVGQVTIDLLITAFQNSSASFEQNIPSEYLDELHGIRDGAVARGYNVQYSNLLVNNLAFDILLGVAYPIVAPILGIESIFAPHMCDGFITYGNGTTDGRTLMGRNFMFASEILHEEMLLIEYCPASGNKFVTPTLPAWVGLVSGMSAQGIGIGIDMAPAIANNVSNVGMGILIASRRMLQYSNTLSAGLSSIKSANLGISWIVAIGSGKNESKGAVLETAATLNRTRYTNYKYPWYFSWLPLPKQIEKKSDLVVFANHFIIPEMVLLAGNPAISDSLWRYETLTQLILNNYGQIDTQKGRQLVDYLHPPAYNYYGTNTAAAIGGSRSLYDLKNGEIWSLYGHYDDVWMDYKF